MLTRLADLATDRPRHVLAATLAAFVVAVVFGAPVAGLLSADDEFDDPDAESQVAAARLDAESGVDLVPGVIVLIRDATPERVRTVEREVRQEERVASTRVGPPSHDGDSRYVAVTLKAGDDEDDVGQQIEERFEDTPGVSVGGIALAAPTVGEQVEKDLARAEVLAFPILFLLSLWVFRGFVAALLPLFVGVLTIVGVFLGLRIVNEITPLSIFALNLAIGMGLGLAIDYSLFVISRYREEMARGSPPREALRTTLRTAGRTVLFSSVTVAVALLSLTVFPQRFLYSMGITGAFAALMAGAVTLLSLPALLALAGRRIARDVPEQGFWYRWARGIMRRPGLVAFLTAGGLLLAGLPVLGIEFTGVDATTLPKESPVRQVDTALRTEFPPAPTSPIVVSWEGSRPVSVDGIPGVAAVEEPRRVGRLTVMEVVPAAPVLDPRSRDVVRDIRSRAGPDVSVSGETATFVDQQEALLGHLPLALAILAFTTFAVLFVMTGSVVLPIKALIMNLLSLSAAFGLLVVIFQDGRLEGLLDYTSQGALESTQPVLMFAVAFALSTDYGVFLLTRIKEARDAGASNDEAVALGLQRTGRIITAAALLLSVALIAFTTSEIIFIKEVGLGTVFAVIIDATIIRALLVPALMALLGEWNWWAPAPLRRLHERIGLTES